MRVALNAQLLSRARSYRSGGISRVIAHLLAELARDPRGSCYEVYLPDRPDPTEIPPSPALAYHASGTITRRPPVRILWEQTVLPASLAAARPDLLHGLAYALPLAWRGPAVLTVYDLSFFRYPGAFNRGNRVYLGAITRWSARHAGRIVTISEHSREDIVRWLRVPPDRVVVAYPAADDRFRVLPAEEVQAFRARQGLPERFLFAVGTLEPRKNLTGLLEAYALLSTPRPPLYVAGATGWRFSPIFSMVERLKLESDVHFLGFVQEADLPLWYNAAHVFAYPSLYEGFGLPVLEAMACGTPVVTSRASSLPEVAGSAALLVEPGDAEGLRAALEELLADPARRQTASAAGLAQARRFSWSDLADQTTKAYRAVLEFSR